MSVFVSKTKAYRAQKQREYRQRHPEKARAHVKRWNAANRDKLNAGKRAWFKKQRSLGIKFRQIPYKAILISLLLWRDSNTCQICGKLVELTEASIDHIVPISLGGTDDHNNVRLSHLKCNQLRGNRQ